MNIDEILSTLPHRYPFLMVDRVEELEPGQSALALKCVSVNEPQFQGHFPGSPVMPGVLISEAFAQVCGIVALSTESSARGSKVYLLGMDKMRFRKPVRPGDTLRIRAEKESQRRGIWTFRCVAHVGETKVADGRIMATVAE